MLRLRCLLSLGAREIGPIGTIARLIGAAAALDVHPIGTGLVTIKARQRQARITGDQCCVMCGEPSVLSTCDACEEARWGFEPGTLADSARLIPFEQPYDRGDEALAAA
jgi:hypothetical protein